MGGCCSREPGEERAWRRGYILGNVLALLLVVSAWSAVLFAQTLQAERVPVETTQQKLLDKFPEVGLIVVSKRCAPGPPFEHAIEEPRSPPALDFASVVGVSVHDVDQATVYMQRPDPSKVLWKSRRYTIANLGGKAYTCAFTAGAFMQTKNLQCFGRTYDGTSMWHSTAGWKDCASSDVGGMAEPFDPMVGLSVGNWSTLPGGGHDAPAHVQTLPSWPEESFFVLPTTEEGLVADLARVDGVLASIAAGTPDYSTELVMQEALSGNFSGGVWAFQAISQDEMANSGPSLITVRSSRCEGICWGQERKLAAELVSAPPRWRQPLCNPSMRRYSVHQGCVPIVFLAERMETVVVRTVAFAWSGLFTQWLSPLVVSGLLCPTLLYLPVWLGGGAPEGSSMEVKGFLPGASKVGLSRDGL